jgi:hypothetical protein
VLDIIRGAEVLVCACAIVLTAGRSVPAVSTAANWITDLVNTFILNKSGVSGKPSGKS